MTIEEFLKSDNARISMGAAWLYYDDNGEWVVLHHAYGKRHSDTLYRGQNLHEALMALRHEEASHD